MARPSIIIQADRVVPRREILLTASLLILTWAIQMRYPPLSYPGIGLIELTILAMLAVMVPVRLLRSMHGAPAPRLHPAFLPGLVFILWAIGRWAFAGFPFTGDSDIGTMLWCACYAIIGYSITRSAASTDYEAPTVSISRMFLFALAALGLLCGIHAAWQYSYAYGESHRLLLAEIGNRQPDRTELGLLYHLKLRRVASIFGDPNSLATFSAMAVAASLELITKAGSGRRRWLQVFGMVAIPACLASVILSGSRGGILDVLFVLLVYGIIALSRRRKGQLPPRIATSAVMVILALALGLAGRPGVAQSAAEEQEPVPDLPPTGSGWVWRSSTITERLYYLQVGARMVAMSPIIGLGPGSVERYFGQLKPPEARESKYLHNWVAQVAAELGLVGLAIAAWFLITMAVAVARQRVWVRPADRAFLLIFVLLLLDGLIQVTWNQREIMSTFGLITGILMGRTVRQGSVNEERFPKAARLAVCVVLVSVFALFEGRFLAGKRAKYMALDAMTAGNYAVARQQWDQATLWTPRDHQPYAARASMAVAAGQLSSARQLLDTALQLNPDSASLNLQAAEVAQALRQDDDALDYLTEALRLYPSHPEYNYAMAQYLMKHGDRLRALKYALNALRYNYLDSDRPRYESLVKELES